MRTTDRARRLGANQSRKLPSEPTAPRGWLAFLWLAGSALAGGGLLWAAFAPLGWSWLAWLAPVPWLWLIQDPKWPARQPYFWIWCAGSLHWLAVLQGIRLPYWALYFGWLALSLYLAVYLPLFVATTRLAVHRLGWPLVVAAPVSWTAWEWVRGYAVTGFSGALLGHTQVHLAPLIQISDLGGAYLVGTLVMFVAACLASLRRGAARANAIWIGLGLLAVAATLGYGQLRRSAPASAEPPLRVALLQGTYNTLFEYNPQRNLDIFHQYLGLAERASAAHAGLDLLVWPESTFTENNPNWIAGDNPLPPPGSPLTPEQFAKRIRERETAFQAKCAEVARRVYAGQPAPAEPPSESGVYQLVGVETVDLSATPTRNHNSALLLDPAGQPVARYDKMHLVMFGEYIPFARWFPWIYRMSPMSGGLTPGQGPVVVEVAGFRLLPNICFESFVPHLIRRQVTQTRQSDQPADILVNLTHDGWFWGSSILDLHLACSVFRAVEHRRPMLVAANPGLTASIDGDGRIRRLLPRETADYLFDEIARDSRTSIYSRRGDVWAVACLGVVLLWCGQRIWQRRLVKSDGEVGVTASSTRGPDRS